MHDDPTFEPAAGIVLDNAHLPGRCGIAVAYVRRDPVPDGVPPCLKPMCCDRVRYAVHPVDQNRRHADEGVNRLVAILLIRQHEPVVQFPSPRSNRRPRRSRARLGHRCSPPPATPRAQFPRRVRWQTAQGRSSSVGSGQAEQRGHLPDRVQPASRMAAPNGQAGPCRQQSQTASVGTTPAAGHVRLPASPGLRRAADKSQPNASDRSRINLSVSSDVIPPPRIRSSASCFSRT